jgi:hypothetical protein
MRYACALLLLTWPFAAAAQTARSVADCEKVKGDLAYNQCLASFGPPARSGSSPSTAGPAEPEEPVEQGRRSRMRTSGSGTDAGVVARRRGGRKSAAFEVVSGRGEPEASSSGRRRFSYRGGHRRR